MSLGTGQSADMERIPCRLCSRGTMRWAVIKPYNLNVGIAMMVAGFLCLITGLLSLLGLILLLIGGYLVWARKAVWLCDHCGAIVERV
ncbi:MAG TPA: hypothetical protein HPP77_08230 [Candidatus Hydrogenedentes bacterium]|nr:hypothetical protein [Candidatus Hydrogenedentota bacterium]HIJ74283.1 hypothetical protein [Candidatus Hydrogenedentota bacterium]